MLCAWRCARGVDCKTVSSEGTGAMGLCVVGQPCTDPHRSQEPGARAAVGTEISYPSSEFP